MSLLFQSLGGLTVIDTVDVTHCIPVETSEGYRSLAIGTLQTFLGTGVDVGTPNTDPASTTDLQLAGVLAGSVSLDGSATVVLTASFVAGSITIADVDRLEADLNGLRTDINTNAGNLATLQLQVDSLPAPAPAQDLTVLETSAADHELRLDTVELNSVQLRTDVDLLELDHVTRAEWSNVSQVAAQTQVDLNAAELLIGQLRTDTDALLAEPDVDLTPLNASVLDLQTRTTALENVTVAPTDLTQVNADIAALREDVTVLQNAAPVEGSGAGWSVVAVDTTMVAGVNYIADASGGPINMALPTVMNAGNSFVVRAYGGEVTVLHNGHTIDSLTFGDDLGLSAGQTGSLAALNATTVIIVS